MLTLFGILAVAASPTFVRLLRDRRVNRAAMHLVDIYRTASTRAMGRGQPIMVTWQQVGTQGRLQVWEPIVKKDVPRTNCQTTAWTDATSVQLVTWVDLTHPAYELAEETFKDDTTGANTKTFAQICFTPMGRAYIRFDAGTTFRTMTGVASFTVSNSENKGAAAYVPRRVFIPPNGVARIQL